MNVQHSRVVFANLFALTPFVIWLTPIGHESKLIHHPHSSRNAELFNAVAQEGIKRPDVESSINKSLRFLAQHGKRWKNERGCVSCHHVPFMIWTHNEAQQRGFNTDTEQITNVTNWALVNMFAEREEVGGADTISQMLLGRNRSSQWRKKPPRHFKTVDPYETLFEILVERQSKDGSWPPEGQLKTPPEITTGWAVLALESRKGQRDDPAIGLDPEDDLGTELGEQLSRLETQLPLALERGLEYLESVEPHQSNEGLILRALRQSQFGDTSAGKTLNQLLARQNADGGWSNRFNQSESDALATGQTLYALAILECEKENAKAIQRGRQFLLNSQQDDGSWTVRADQVRVGKRNESLDEVYSYWGTAWAVLGILQTSSSADR